MTPSVETEIYITRPDGKRAMHGYIKGDKFIRRLDRSKVFWRERAFGINVGVLGRLREHNVKKLIFIVEHSDKWVRNEFDFANLGNCPVILLPGGEKNYKVPMVACATQEKMKDAPNAPAAKVEKLHQTSLFTS